jgi:ribonuclease PH
VSERSYGRGPSELRPTAIEPGFVRTAAGSALISIGETRVICTASVQETVPRWMTGKGAGWVTAEYGMLPASTGERKQRDATRGRQDGRTVEIQRLIGRSLRAVVDFQALGERTIYLDCDVLQADGGTRCASITGAYVALSLSCARLLAEDRLERSALTGSVAAVSCGMVGGMALLDLDYSEDRIAEVDANVVMTGEGGLVEVQATAERTPLSRAHLDELLALAAAGAVQLRAAQEQAVAEAPALATPPEPGPSSPEPGPPPSAQSVTRGR